MEQELLRKVQLTQLEIALEVRRVCAENGIACFLDSGTLLGAVRHQGFIPWDDDLDLAMLRPEYERFLAVAPGALRPGYFLQTWDTDPGYPFPFAKVRKLGTVLVEATAEYTDAHQEIWVDIFPYDRRPDGRWDTIRQAVGTERCKYTLWMKCGLRPWAAWEGSRRRKSWLMSLPFRLLAPLSSRKRLQRGYLRAARRWESRPTQKLFETGMPYGTWEVDASCFERLVPLVFEGETFPAPGDWDLYLRTIYGDYMQLPPPEKRGNQHRIVKVVV